MESIKRILTLKIEVDIYDLEQESLHCTGAQIDRTDGTFFTGWNKDDIGRRIDEMKGVADAIINCLKLDKKSIKIEY